MENPYANPKFRLIRGEMPKLKDLQDWGPGKILSFLNFFDHFTHDGVIKINLDLRRAAELQASDNHYWTEFLQRIDVADRLGAGTNTKFRLRLTTMARVILMYLKKNPFEITEEMSRIMTANPRCHWALNSFKEESTRIPTISTVTMNNHENTDPFVPNIQSKMTQMDTPMVQFNEAVMHLTSILKNLTKGISAADMKKMSTADKLKHSNALMNSLAKVFSQYKPNNMVFKQININASSKDELEQAILDYSSEQ